MLNQFYLSAVVFGFLVCLQQNVLGYTWYVLTKYDHFAKRPDANAIRSGGRLTTREIQYLRNNGYNSYISTVEFNTTDQTFNGMEGPFPSTKDEIAFAESIGFETFAMAAAMTAEDVVKVSDAINAMKKPVYIHCHVGFSATLFTLLHLYRTGAILDSNVFSAGLALGWDYQANTISLTLINQVTGLNAPLTNPTIEIPLTNGESSYKTYYWPHYLNDYWYNAGQVLSTHAQAIHDQGYKVIISLRANGEATLRLPTDPATGPVANNEFSDENGNYDASLEQNAFESLGVQFFNLAVSGGDAWVSSTFFEYLPTFQAAEKVGPVLVHCASGYRSSAYAATYLAYSQKKCTSWALKQASRVGYSFDYSTSDAVVVDFMRSVLKC